MKTKLNSEYLFTKELENKTKVSLTLHIDYKRNTYNFFQDGEEGIMPRLNHNGVEMNMALMELGLEVLEFVEQELYSIEDYVPTARKDAPKCDPIISQMDLDPDFIYWITYNFNHLRKGIFLKMSDLVNENPICLPYITLMNAELRDLIEEYSYLKNDKA